MEVLQVERTPLHSADDHFVREGGPPRTPRKTAVPPKPFLTPDPEGLQWWRDTMKDFPEVVPPAPGFVRDERRTPAE